MKGSELRNPHGLPVKTCAACGRPFTWRVHFLATAGAAARGPAASYRLAIETSGRQTAHTCHAGLAATDNAGTRESIHSDFTADEDILVLFVE